MTTRTRRLRPLFQALKRRSILPAYFDLSGKGLFLLVVLGASLLGLLALAQAGRVVAVGHEMKQLQKAEENMLWEQESLLEEIARSNDPEVLELWALEQGMEPMTLEDISFIPLPPLPLRSSASTSSLAERPK